MLIKKIHHSLLALICLVLIVSPASSQIIYNQVAKLVSSNPGSSSLFGYASVVSADGNTIIIGSLYDRIGTNNSQGSAYIFIRNGTTWTQQARLIASDGAAGDNFGISVAISSDGNTVVIGALFTTINGNVNQGAGYVIIRSGTSWIQQTKLIAGDGAPNDELGFSVAVSADGNTALLGAYTDAIGNNSNQGSAYIFTRNGTTWNQQAKLIANDGTSGDQFGYSAALSIDGNTAAIGVIFGDGTVSNQGTGYVFVRSGTTWAQQAKLAAVNPNANAYMGRSISISGDGTTIVAGASDDVVGTNIFQGSAYVFTRSGNTWSQQARLTASDGASTDFFGRSVSISMDGNKLVVGANEDGVNSNNNQGSAYIFTRSNSTWTQQVQLLASDGAANDLFGFYVSMSGDANTVVVGSIADDVTLTDQGSAYVYIGNIPLPVTFVDFSVSKQMNNSVLTWQVAQEENITTYTIERSTDGRNFTTIGSVASLGNTTAARNYNFTDVDPFKGANYYRLKITEKDGKVNYSVVRLFNWGSQISIALYPNPAKEKATLTGVEAGMSIRLLNASGKVLQLQKAVSTTETLQISTLSKGAYNLQVYSTNGSLLSSTSLVKE